MHACGQRVAGTAGFTLMELLVVLLMLAGAFALASPTLPLRGGSDPEPHDALRHLVERVLRIAGESGRDLSLVLHLDSGEYVVRTSRAADLRDPPIFQGVLSMRGWHADSYSEGREVLILVSPLGRVQAPSVHFQDEGGRRTTLHVESWTGRIHVERK